MKRWKTQEVIDLFDDFDCNIEINSPGGDYDTENLYITKSPDSDYAIYVMGFEPIKGTWNGDYGKMKADMDVSAVMVSDGLDHSGGCNARNKEDILFYAEIRGRIADAGFPVINHYDEIF